MKCQFKWINIVFILILITIFDYQIMKAQAIQLCWSSNPENDIKYYGIYKDTTTSPKIEIAKVPATDTSYIDNDITFGQKYYYRIIAVDSADNMSKFSDDILIIAQYPTPNIISVEVNTPEKFELSQNYPNPFSTKNGSACAGNTGTTIKYMVAKEGIISIVVFDILGRMIRKLIDEHKQPGYYEVRWDGKDNDGNDAGIGVYFCRMTGKRFSQMKKIILAR